MKYSWEEFDKDVGKILQWVSSKKFTGIYGIPRGGLVLAVHLSNMLDLPLILDKNKIDGGTLIIDDISDTGKTLEPFRKGGNIIVTLFFHKQTTVLPDFYLREKIEDDWVYFPWDNPEKKYRDGTIF